MSLKIKQGDAYAVPLDILLEGESVAPEDASVIEVYVGDVRKTYPGEISYLDGKYYFPLTQAETFAMAENSQVDVDLRVKFSGGDVIGVTKKGVVVVVDATSEVIL